ncbi:Uncharacterised protein [Legionella beliardensis]|uniref:Relaxosome protein TraY n=1 Tax=Legionella beliardensis TaxID=91822 RepID=A0A378JNS5_9GAMM|nr:TraY domain-containing protein [Legionella beliardensis]STX55461.1 Uncharacterised protein [Legionella beliardensis]STX55534.1 Uncharacterised protein [Legionella beliardensis]
MDDTSGYKAVYITLRISKEENELLSISAERSGRNKNQEAKIRLRHSLGEFRTISERYCLLK